MVILLSLIKRMGIRSPLVDQRETIIHGDLALILLIPVYPDVVLFTPACAQAVLNNPIVIYTITAPANGQYLVV
jgi:hypothetical protein